MANWFEKSGLPARSLTGANGWKFQLFVRENQKSAYIALGPVELKQYEGDKPISIIWKLKYAMPIEIFRRFSVLRGG